MIIYTFVQYIIYTIIHTHAFTHTHAFIIMDRYAIMHIIV